MNRGAKHCTDVSMISHLFGWYVVTSLSILLLSSEFVNFIYFSHTELTGYGK